MVNIDTVYQTVQALANKEQRGYITPQEFNLFANQAQQDIFEQYLYDLNALREKRPETHQLGDSVAVIMNKLRSWYSMNNVAAGIVLPPAPANIGRIFLGAGANRRTLKLIDPDKIKDLLASPFHKMGFRDAVYFDDGDRRIQVWDKTGQISTGVTCEVITGRPPLAYWGYVVINEKPTYDPTSTQHFDLEIGEQADLVVKVLKLAGVSTEDTELYQAATAEEQQNLQQENK